MDKALRLGWSMLKQRTLREKVSCFGVGLHTGSRVHMELVPAVENSGIVFVRTDLPGSPEITASVEAVKETVLATTLCNHTYGSEASVGTVEHLLAALRGLGLDNVRVLLDGPEVPIMDGSAKPFVDMLIWAGVESQKKTKRFLVIKKDIKIVDGEKYAHASSGHGFRLTCSVDFDHPVILSAPYRFDFSETRFLKDIASARTFGFLRDVEMLRARGLVRGGSLDNAVVIDELRVLNPEGLRYPNEFVRHKVLDALGDFALLGMPIVGKITLHRTGHALNTRLMRAVLADPKAYEIVEPAHVEAVRLVRGERSPFAVFEPVESWTLTT